MNNDLNLANTIKCSIIDNLEMIINTFYEYLDLENTYDLSKHNGWSPIRALKEYKYNKVNAQSREIIKWIMMLEKLTSNDDIIQMIIINPIKEIVVDFLIVSQITLRGWPKYIQTWLGIERVYINNESVERKTRRI